MSQTEVAIMALSRPRNKRYRSWLASLSVILLVLAMTGPGIAALAFAEDVPAESGTVVEAPAPEQAAPEAPKEEPKEEPPAEEPAPDPAPIVVVEGASDPAPLDPATEGLAAPLGSMTLSSGSGDDCETPPESGSISGHKFKDGTESGISGVKFKIKLLKKDDSGHYVEVASTWSADDGSGDWSFTGLANGKYRVEEDPGTWVQMHVPTYPSDKDYWKIEDGQKSYTGLNFYNKPKTDDLKLSVVIHKYNDLDNSGHQDSGEPHMANREFTLDGPNGFTAHDKTDSYGVLVFDEGLTPGQYTLTEDTYPGWRGWSDTFTLAGSSSPSSLSLSSGSGSCDTPAEPKVVKVEVDVPNLEWAKVTVNKYHDLDANGRRDSGEPATDMEFELTGPDYHKHLTTSGGTAVFDELVPGSYTLKEIVTGDWHAEPASQSFTLAAGGNKVCDVGNFKHAKVEISKFNDPNDDGSQTIPQSGISFTLTNVDTEVALTDSTDNEGKLSFKDLMPGTYELRENLSGWFTKPGLPQTFTLVSGECWTRSFCNTQFAKITVKKFNDLNGNGIKNDNEPWLDWEFDLNGTNAGGVVSKSGTTVGGDGYEFAELRPGTYQLSESLPLDGSWYQTTDLLNTDIALAAGDTKVFVVGNTQYGTVVVQKYNDLDGNGEWNDDEPWLAREFTLSGPSNPAPAYTVTDDAGKVTFSGLKAGDYTLSETAVDHWYVSSGMPEGSFALAGGETKPFMVANRQMVHKGWKLTYPGFPQGTTFRVEYQVGNDPAKTVTLDSNLEASVEVTAVANIVSWQWIATNGDRDFLLGSGAKEAISADTTNTLSYSGSVSGIKFRDMQPNGIKDAGDDPLGDWEIRLYRAPQQDSYLASSVTVAAGEETPTVPADYDFVAYTRTLTDGSGSYSFAGLLPGRYLLTEVAQDGWTCTVSPGEFTVENGTALTGQDFGNWIPFSGFTDPDLGILKTASVSKATAGSVVTYTLKYTNIGVGSAVDFVVTDTFDPTQLEVVGAAGGTVSSGKIVWNIAEPLAHDASRILTVTMRIKSGVAVGTVVANTGSVSISDLVDPTPQDDTSVARVTVASEPYAPYTEPFLPFTGAELWLLLLAAAVFGIAGLTLRRLAVRRA
jgi:uncharacterized repeat protein (TIGR01451 family)